MRPGQSQRAGFSLAVFAAALLAWALSGALGAPSSGSAKAAPPSVAHPAAGCDASCQGVRDRRKRTRADLRRRNAEQKRPNVIVIDTDDQNVTDMFVMRKTL